MNLVQYNFTTSQIYSEAGYHFPWIGSDRIGLDWIRFLIYAYVVWCNFAIQFDPERFKEKLKKFKFETPFVFYVICNYL